MLKEILTELKKQEPNLECWTEGLKKESFNKNVLTISVPNQSYLQKYENGCKDKIAKIATEITRQKVYVQLQLLLPKIETIQLQKSETETKTEIKKFDGNPNFKNKVEVEKYVGYAEKEEPKDIIISIAETKPMPNPYSVENVACFKGLIGQFFTLPNDKRKSAKVKIKVKCQNGDVKEYDLYRGQFKFKDKGKGQLNTTHAKILLAVTHMWQKQGCRYTDDGGFSCRVRLSVRELAKMLGLKTFSGATSNWITKQLNELGTRYNLLSDGKRGIGFTLISRVVYNDVKNNRDKLIANITFNPYIAKQLYERKAFYRNPECYKMRNPTAIKLLLTYDRAIIKGNIIQKTVEDIACDMQIQDKRKDSIIRDLKNAIKELDGYELDEKYSLKVGINKFNRSYIVIAKRVLKNTSIT